MNVLRQHIRKLIREAVIPEQEITEERGLSNSVLEIYEELFNPKNIEKEFFIKGIENNKWITFSNLMWNVKNFPGIMLNLKFAFVNKSRYKESKYIKLFPVIEGGIGLAAVKYDTTSIQLILDDSAKNYSIEELKNNKAIKQVIIHEIQHLNTNYIHIQKGWEKDDYNNHNFLPDTKKLGANILNHNAENELQIQHLLYYISKDELNSIISQIASSQEKENNIVYQLFLNYKNLSFEQFVQEMNEHNPTVKVNKKMYLKVMDRIKYFFRKADRTFTGYN